jgi:glycyl-radical enzyme activating protein
MDSHKARIRFFDIAWDSDKDGPGSRVVVYLQGCHLDCPWCHSPHSISRPAPIQLFRDLCRYCGTCGAQCPQGVHQVDAVSHTRNTEACIRCGSCVEACPVSHRGDSHSHGPLRQTAHTMSVESLFRHVAPQLELWRGVGGITLSGGEPLLQHRQITSLLQMCKSSGYHTAVETSASLPVSCLLSVDEWVDCWLFGIRPVLHHNENRLQDMELVLNNLESLASRSKAKIVIRTPIIPGYTDAIDGIDIVLQAMRRHKLARIELLPFNPYSEHYYQALDKPFPMAGIEPLPDNTMEGIRQHFSNHGIEAAIVR